jgi:spermidine synthase
MTTMNQAGRPLRHGASLCLMLASGFAGLGYQMVWTQQCALWLGHESAAVLAVVAAFFGGLALGALLMGPRIERSARPVRWYVACEMLIAVWGLVLLWAISPFSGWLLDLTGVQPSPMRQWLLAFGGTFLLLLPATTAMGATLPAMERVMAPLRAARRAIAAFYASNTLGAVLGVLCATFWLVPQWGLTHTAAICVALNLLCALGALALLPSRVESDETLPSPSSPKSSSTGRCCAWP